MPEQEEKTIREEEKLIVQQLKEDPYQKFNLAFVFMSVIPLLVFFYILVSKLFSFNILIGDIGLILALTITIVIAGYYVGYIIIRDVLKKVIFYAAQVKRSEELKSEFVASVSHELKNPIAILKSNIFNLIEGFLGKVTDEQKGILKVCSGILDRMTRLTFGLLDLYKIEAGMEKLKVAECDITGIFKRQFEEFTGQLNEKGISLVQEMPKKGLKAFIDEAKIEQVVHNVVGNAIKYTPSGGTVTVNLSSGNDFIRFECQDTGEGIPRDKLQKIFDKFERISKAKEGTGLGLTITKDLVELHKGKIWAESEEGKGSKFIVVLPQDGRKNVKGDENGI